MKYFKVDYLDGFIVLFDEEGKEILRVDAKYSALEFKGEVINPRAAHQR